MQPISRDVKRQPELIKNLIDRQLKTGANTLSIEEWNYIINVLKDQTNQNTRYLEMLHKLMFGDWSYDIATETLTFTFDDPSIGVLQQIQIDYTRLINKIKEDIISFKAQVSNELREMLERIPFDFLDTVQEAFLSLTGRVDALEQDILDLESNKVDKVAGKRLSTNDLTDTLKDYYDTAYAHSQIIGSNPHQTTYEQVLNRPSFAAVATSGEYEDLEGKPDLDLKLDKNFSALPAQTNALLTDVLVLNRGSTAQKVTLANLLAQVDNKIFEVVGVLPTTGDVNKIYLVPSDEPETQNILDEFIWVGNAWEKIGAVSVDLNNYYNKTDVDSMLGNKVDKNIDITPNTFPKITYDAKGLVTGGGKLAATDIPSLAASKISSGTFDEDRIPNLPATKISSGIFTADRIPNLDADKISSGVFSYARIPNLLADKIVAGTFHIDRIPYLTEEKIPDLHANKITAGEFSVSLIPELEISKTYGLQDALDTLEDNKQDKLVPGYNITIDEDNVISAGAPDSTSYFNYASSIYGDKYNLFANAWLHSLTVDPSEIGTAQYPMGDTYGVIIPQGVTTIGANAFKDWTENNQPLVIPNSVTSIGNSAFSHWVLNNQPLVIPNSVTSIERFAFYNWFSNNQPLTIQNGVTSIGGVAFGNWYANNHPLIIPNSVTSIEGGAFQDWSSNNQPLTISNSVTSIGTYAFLRWESNTHPLVIPASVTDIGEMAFYSWKSVPYVEIHATTPPTLADANAFYDQNFARIYVPDESVDDYRTATNWVTHASSIFPISERTEIVEQNANKYTDEEVAKKVDLTADQYIDGYKHFTGSLFYKDSEVLTTETGEIYEQQLTSLYNNKLNKIWTDVVEQTTINLTDVLVFNRGTNVYKTKVSNLLAHVGSEIFEVVSMLPTVGVTNKIYLVTSSKPETQNELDEFIWVDGAWERIGGVTVDLGNYFNKTEINSLLGNKVDKVAGKGLSTNDYTNTDKQSVEKIPTIEQDILDLESNKVDFDAMTYFNYAGIIYGDKYNLLVSAWEHSLTVDPLEISVGNSIENEGKVIAQYPNGDIEGVIIPNGVTTIGNYAFMNWTTNNQPLVIPNSVTTVEEYAFFGWTSNTHPLIIPSSITSIGYRAFEEWESNTHPLIIPDSVTSLGDRAFAAWISNNHPLIIPNSITSIGSHAFHYWKTNNQPLVIPNTVTTIGENAFGNWVSNNQTLVIPNSVTSIGTLAFYAWHKNTRPLVIPSSVTSIGDRAFDSWALVPYVEIHATTPPTLANANAFNNQNNAPIYVPDESVEAYKAVPNWEDLADRIFPISNKPDDEPIIDEPIIDEIGLNEMTYFNYAGSIYGDKYSLLVNAWARSLTVDPSEISEDGSMSSSRGTAQYPNGEIEGVIIPTSVTDIGYNAFEDWTTNNQPLVIPNSVTRIHGGAFSNWESNTHQLIIPSSVTSIGGGTFEGWRTNNQPLIIPSSVTIIGDGAFGNWESNNQPLVIPGSLTTIPYGAFQYWFSNNQPLTIQNGVTNIKSSAFAHWYANTHQLVIPNSVTDIGSSAFARWSANNQPLIIPNSVTSISNSAFWDWTSNNQPLVIPDSVTSIEGGAFQDWSSNNQPLVIPRSVIDIGYGAFKNWSANTHPLVIPNNVYHSTTSIGEYAFNNWSSIPYVEIQAIVPPSIASSNAFDEQNNVPIYVPDICVDDYKTATNWIDLADRIFPISDKPDDTDVIGDIESALDAILGV